MRSIDFPYVPKHVCTCGNGRPDMFLAVDDHKRFLAQLRDTVEGMMNYE